MNYTPGPWRVKKHGDKIGLQRFNILGPGDVVVAQVLPSLKQGEADAQVIAAVPSMVAALQTIVDERDGSWQANVAREALEEAGIDA
jgi:hypothetical protein